MVDMTAVNSIINNSKVLNQTSPKNWFLNANISIAKGATLFINSSDTDWLKINSTTTGTGSVASPSKATGPNWLSFSPSVSPTRTFPKLSTILAGLYVTPRITGGDAAANIEALSSVSRTLNFERLEPSA